MLLIQMGKCSVFNKFDLAIDFSECFISQGESSSPNWRVSNKIGVEFCQVVCSSLL